MAKVNVSVEQSKALDEIAQTLKTIETYNIFINPGDSLELAIVSIGDGKINKSQQLPIANDELGKLKVILERQKKKLCADVKAKAKKFGISLDDDEILLLGE